MKRFSTVILIAIGLISGSALSFGHTSAATAKLDKAVVEFNEPIKLMNVILKGEYLFVHDEEKMAQGLDCTYVYNHDKGKQGKLVTSFHCVPIERQKGDSFTVLVEWNQAVNMAELVEYRFAGDAEGHKVPKPSDSHH